ncbi:hypothetical protein GCM10011352_15810 [Marinobacterium zhoushanense]|uniref:Uncharacterized protein n=1 Tax=Marinobacterium zhoushanense TaxID=1679163 RepID=A0ABQ1KAQ4_9GAMM|nr:hypothetical protein GCM10011352_15810 [Marinobacterium zhoushanense]
MGERAQPVADAPSTAAKRMRFIKLNLGSSALGVSIAPAWQGRNEGFESTGVRQFGLGASWLLLFGVC